MQYLIMYVLGALKSQIISIPVMQNQIDTVDKLVYTRFQAMQMNPEELLPLFSP